MGRELLVPCFLAAAKIAFQRGFVTSQGLIISDKGNETLDLLDSRTSSRLQVSVARAQNVSLAVNRCHREQLPGMCGVP